VSSDRKAIIGGAFAMGSENGDRDERPVHMVHVDYFLIFFRFHNAAPMAL
jgi:hypothetical protein